MENQCKFLCGLGTIFEQSPTGISNCSIMYAHISQGVLYEGVGFTKEYIEEIGHDIFEKPFKDCKALCNCTFIRKSKIKQNACTFCKLSTTYLNDRLQDERTCLRYTLFTGKTCVLEPSSFLSVTPLAAGNDISTYPLITFNKYLFMLLNENIGAGPISQRDLSVKLSNYIAAQLNYNDERSKDITTTCVNRELNILYTAEPNSLTDSLANTSQLRLMNSYAYTPPIIAKASTTDGLDNLEKKNKIEYTQNSSNQIQKDDINDCMDLNTQEMDKCTIDTENLVYEEITEPEEQTVNVINIENEHSQNKNVVCDVTKENTSTEEPIDESNLQMHDKKKSKKKSKHIEPFQKLEDFNEHNLPLRKCDDCVTDILYNSDIMSNLYNTCFEFNKCSLLFPNYQPSNAFKREITNCGMDNSNIIHNFLCDSCNSTVIGIESIRLDQRDGLLFYMYVSNKFYFFDVDFALSSFLLPMLEKAYKVKYLSMHSIPVTSMLKKLGFDHVRIECISSMYTIVSGLNYNSSFKKIIESTLNMKIDKGTDFYQFAMPLYNDLYEVLATSISSKENYLLLADYEKHIKFNEVLGRNYDLSYIVSDLDKAIDGINMADYRLHYERNMTIIKKGIMYVLTIPDMQNINQKDSLAFLQDICCKVQASPFKCVSDAYLLSIFSTGVAYFTPGEGDVFFDILLDVARRCYRKTFKEMPVIKTHRVEYS